MLICSDRHTMMVLIYRERKIAIERERKEKKEGERERTREREGERERGRGRENERERERDIERNKERERKREGERERGTCSSLGFHWLGWMMDMRSTLALSSLGLRVAYFSFRNAPLHTTQLLSAQL